MTFAAHVDGGTGAGRKRPLLPANTIPWRCNCKCEEKLLPCTCKGSCDLKPGYLKRCIDCGTSRDPA